MDGRISMKSVMMAIIKMEMAVMMPALSSNVEMDTLTKGRNAMMAIRSATMGATINVFYKFVGMVICA